MSGFLVPAYAARHRHPLVKHAIPVAHLLWEHRHHLDQAIKDVHGHTILPALPHLRLRPLKGETTEQLKKRRSDFMQAFLAVWLVQLGSISYRSKAVLSRGHSTSPDPFMSLRELAELAELVTPDYVVLRKVPQPDGTIAEVVYRDPGDRVERVTRFQRAIGMIGDTKQHREKKPDGRFRAAGAGIRRMIFKVACYAFGGQLAKTARNVHALEMQKAEAQRVAQAEADEAFRAALAEQEARQGGRYGEHLEEMGEPADPEPIYRVAGQPDPVIADQVASDHPTWELHQILAEAREIERHIYESTGPPGDTS